MFFTHQGVRSWDFEWICIEKKGVVDQFSTPKIGEMTLKIRGLTEFSFHRTTSGCLSEPPTRVQNDSKADDTWLLSLRPETSRVGF